MDRHFERGQVLLEFVLVITFIVTLLHFYSALSMEWTGIKESTHWRSIKR